MGVCTGSSVGQNGCSALPSARAAACSHQLLGSPDGSFHKELHSTALYFGADVDCKHSASTLICSLHAGC